MWQSQIDSYISRMLYWNRSRFYQSLVIAVWISITPPSFSITYDTGIIHSGVNSNKRDKVKPCEKQPLTKIAYHIPRKEIAVSYSVTSSCLYNEVPLYREVACSYSDHERQVPLYREVACSCSDHERQVPLYREAGGLLMQWPRETGSTV